MPEVKQDIFNYRSEQCRMCPKPCEHRLVEEYLVEASNGCPRNRWMPYETYQRPDNWRGAGDVVAAIAQPIAGAIDKLLGTNVKGCAACAQRREMLNQYLPFPSNKAKEEPTETNG